MLKCPVCKNDQPEDTISCTVCGFPQLKCTFLNVDEAKLWLENTVEPCRAIWNKCKKYRSIGYQRLSYRQCPTEISSIAEVDRPGMVYAITSSNNGKLAPIQIEGAITYDTVQHFTASSFCRLDNVDDNLGNAVDYFRAMDGVRRRLQIARAHLALEFRPIGNGVSQECPCLASVIAMYSLLKNAPFMNEAIFVGEMSISGKIKTCNKLHEIFELCASHNIKKILLPITAAMDLGDVSAELIGRFSLIFYSNVNEAIAKALQIQGEDALSV